MRNERGKFPHPSPSTRAARPQRHHRGVRRFNGARQLLRCPPPLPLLSAPSAVASFLLHQWRICRSTSRTCSRKGWRWSAPPARRAGTEFEISGDEAAPIPPQNRKRKGKEGRKKDCIRLLPLFFSVDALLCLRLYQQTKCTFQLVAGSSSVISNIIDTSMHLLICCVFFLWFQIILS